MDEFQMVLCLPQTSWFEFVFSEIFASDEKN
jgi:hypothetical protein